jgi:hypothetical protein
VFTDGYWCIFIRGRLRLGSAATQVKETSRRSYFHALAVSQEEVLASHHYTPTPCAPRFRTFNIVGAKGGKRDEGRNTVCNTGGACEH